MGEDMIKRARIAGTGHMTGPSPLTNEDLTRIVDTTDEWIVSRTGIKRRMIIRPEDNMVTSDLATGAGRKALEAAELTPEDLDLILVGTVTPDCKFPSTAVFVQAKLGAMNAAAMDLSAACSGWGYGMELANSLIRCGQKKCVLVIGAEVLTSITNWEDRGTCVLFGDAAGAVVLVPSEDESGILATYTKANGELAELLWAPGCGTLRPLSPESLANKDHVIHMNGRRVYTHAVRCMADACQQSLDLAGITPDQVDLLIPHQANIRIIEATCERFGIPQEKCAINIEKYGNTSSASIPLALDEAIREGRVGAGSLVLYTVFGGGFTWASGLIRL